MARQAKIDANDAVDAAHSAASECHKVVALERTTLKGAVQGRGYDSEMAELVNGYTRNLKLPPKERGSAQDRNTGLFCRGRS